MGVTPRNHPAHVVLVPYPAQGHIPPVVHLAKKLAAQGIIVTLINVDSIHKMVLKQWSCEPEADIRLEAIHCDIPIPSAGVDASCLKDPDVFVQAIETLVVPVEELIRKLSPAPCCILGDFFLGWPVEVAKAMDIVPAVYWPGNAAWSSVQLHADLLRASGYISCEDDEPDRIVTSIPGVFGLRRSDLPDYFRISFEGRVYFYRLVFEYQCHMNEYEWILVNSMVELELDAFQAMQVILPRSNFTAIGPLFPVTHGESPTGVSLQDEDEACLKWLDTQAESSVLYISFGSISVLSATAFEEIASGVEASKQPFLWVKRKDMVETSAAHNEFCRGFLERTEQQGLVVTWAPQLKVLAHKSTGGFLSHCGWNSTLESICYGVPLLGLPCHSEQRMNAKMVEQDWALGKRLLREQEQVESLTRDVVETRIRDFMDDDEIRKRAKEIEKKAAATANQGGNSYKNVVAFAEGLKAKAMEMATTRQT